MTNPVLSIEHLSIKLPDGADRQFAVDDCSYTLDKGEILCVVGESGSGKSMTANALMGLLPEGVSVGAGRAVFEGKNILRQTEAESQDLRGAKIAMIFQEPMTALNPLMRIGDQISEVFEAHKRHTPSERRKRALDLVREVDLPDPEKIIRAYPFQLSGGQRQRAMIAMALALEPQILIADEPTTALDVTTQAQILKLILDLRKKRDMAVIFITHDFGVVAEIADKVLVMRYGKIVERGTTDAVLKTPQHDYTKHLLAAIPSGLVPQNAEVQNSPALEIKALNKVFRTGGGFMKPHREVRAIDNISLSIAKGEVLGLVGESGSGKSTLGRAVVRLVTPDSGQILVGGSDMAALSETELRRARYKVQMVFQDPYASLNPRHKILRALTDGPIAKAVPKEQARARAHELMEIVGLGADAVDRFPHEFSGGQRQRIGIARALAMDPDLIIADEAVSALDVSIQAQVLDLLRDLRSKLNLSILFITHDLRVAAQLCDRIAVMQKGKLVEIGPVSDVFLNPQDDYTKRLLAAVPGGGWGLAEAALT
ncbi:Glutathione import ATP-binding protein GsiA [Thalassovita gelatinovora]|uniref:Glutathione import ATP-binding protein GsiA n=1 Tax=Thalassovita gelatinovora TaxID=53501 RepID=A0A0P1G245_THAGE|nr:ABC transporter ATP-binding protein [Thalassovita gelatinovora]QIZ80452.1 ABC transporter ATP-binding protein [Thalassovita gelatinovora]CUH65863.1 Glutathione import ATP-binding protein GsiA [Thalassovita gelatinovora]SEQ72874.1 peptide/nickel transport system ATP-binding protein [Thalassovita gelatinovora]